MLIRLWSLNRVLRFVGLTVSIKHPGSEEAPTVIRLSWIGWGLRARAADDQRGPASGYERDELGEQRYLRCIEASDAAWDEAVEREYGTRADPALP